MKPKLGKVLGAARLGEKDLLQRAFESGLEPRLITDAGGIGIHANAAFQRTFDCSALSPLEALQARFQDNAESLETLERMRTSASSGAEARAELAAGAQDGKTDWHIIRAHPLHGRPGYVLWTVEDITDRHEMEQIIRDEQRKLFDFFENAPVGFYSVDAEGRFLFVNNTFAEWLGRSAEELTRSAVRLRDIVAEKPPADTPAYDPFGHSGEVLHGRVMLNGTGDRRFEADISQTIVRGENGAGLWTRSVVRDLSREREMARALEASEQRFRKFFENAPVGIALLDLTGVVVEANYVFNRTMGQASGGSLNGRRLVDLVDETDRADFTARLEGVAERASFAAPIEVRVGEGGETVVTFYVSAVDDGDGPISGFILHALDTTEQKSLEVQFAHSQKMQAVGQLAGGIAHDFNNLLTAMIGFCDLLLLRFRPGEQSFADIMQIKQNANRATNLVRQLLAFSRQQTLQPKRLDVTDVLAELSYLLRRLIGENIELKMVHGRDLGRVRGDQGQLEQVIINLAVNARDAMAGGGTLTIRTRNVAGTEAYRHGHDLLPSGDYVLIEVIDSGEGIPKAHIGRIFEPFFSTKEVGSGTGLGLSTVYGIVKQTGGFIFVDSAPTEGARFSIFLPRNREADGEPAQSIDRADAAPLDLSGAGTVLLVEDEDPVRMFGARALRNKGYKVYEAKSGQSALEVMGSVEDKIDLIITDVVMPQMDGPTLIMRVRETAPETKIICISGYAEDAFRKRLDRSADIHFLPKPFSLNQLAGKVKEVLRARS